MSMTALTDLLLRLRLPLGGVILTIAVACAWFAPGVRFDFSIEPLIQGGAEQIARVEEFARVVPPETPDLTLAAEWPHPVGGAELGLLAEVEAALDALPEVESTLSLSSISVAVPRAGLPVPVSFRELVGDRTALEVGREHPLLLGTLLARQGRAAAIHIRLAATESPESKELGRQAVMRQLAEFDSALPDVRLIGGAVVQREMSDLMRRDVLRGLLLEALVFLVLLPLLFRSLRGTVLPFIAILAAVLLNVGAHLLLDSTVSIIEVAIPGLIVIIGLCDAVHMMQRFEDALEHRSWNDSIREMMDRVGVACLFTSFTTGIGFLSLALATHPAVRTFGIKAAVAVLITFSTVVVVLPIGLSLWPRAWRRPISRGWSLSIRYGRPRLTVLLFGLLLLASILGAARVAAEARWLEELPEENVAVADLRWFEERFDPFLAMEVRIAGDLDDPTIFRAVERLEREFNSSAGIVGSESYTHWVRELLGNPTELGDAQIRAGLGFLSLSGELFPHHLVNSDFSTGRLAFRTGDTGTRRFAELSREVARIADSLPDGLSAEVAGYALMATESTLDIILTMLRSFLLSLAAITLFVSLIYRSWRIGLASVLPNLLPILVALGVNGWLDIPLRIGIVMIYSLGLGLAVDDSIHLLTRFVQERRDNPAGSIQDALQRSLAGTGKALLVTSIILVAGCLCYLPSEFRSMNDVGLLLSVVVVSALLADLFLLPVIVEKFGSGPDRT